MDVYFSGLGIEIGQSKRGLAKSPLAAKKFLSHHGNFDFIDLGESSWAIQSPLQFLKNTDLNLFRSQDNFFSKSIKKNIAIYEGLGKKKLLNWGGDHSLGLITVASFKSCFPTGKILWIDAHADLNIPSFSLSGNLHGMPVGLLLNLENVTKTSLPNLLIPTVSPQDIFYLGLRDLDPYESETLEDLSIAHLTYQDTQTLGLETCLDMIKQWHQGHPLHVSFDIDSVNPDLAPSTGVPVAGGFNTEDLKAIGKSIQESSQLISIDIAEVNPDIGSAPEVYATFLTCIQFLNSIFKGDKYEKNCYSIAKSGQSPMAQASSFSSPAWHFY